MYSFRLACFASHLAAIWLCCPGLLFLATFALTYRKDTIGFAIGARCGSFAVVCGALLKKKENRTLV
jgi:hypothetical protein